MPLWSLKDKSIFFAHVPKTAGSSLEEYLIRRMGQCTIVWSAAIDRGGSGLLTAPVHFAKNDLKMFLPAKIDFSFTLVRDPIARLMSEYRYQAGLSRASRLGFSTWLRIVLEAAKRDPRTYRNHIRPQVDLVPDGAEIFRLEDGFEPIIARLDEVLGQSEPSLSVPHINKRPSQAITLYRQDAALLRDFYAEDYARLGYDLPDLANLPSDPFALGRAAMARVIAPAIVAWQHYRWVRPQRIPRRLAAVATSLATMIMASGFSDDPLLGNVLDALS